MYALYVVLHLQFFIFPKNFAQGGHSFFLLKSPFRVYTSFKLWFAQLETSIKEKPHWDEMGVKKSNKNTNARFLLLFFCQIEIFPIYLAVCLVFCKSKHFQFPGYMIFKRGKKSKDDYYIKHEMSSVTKLFLSGSSKLLKENGNNIMWGHGVK